MYESSRNATVKAKKEPYPKIKDFQDYVYESMSAFRDWRAESWRDCEMTDGGKSQWTEQDWQEAIDAGIDPLTINRIWPITNIIKGSQALSRFNIMAKGRTQKDSETGQVMSESIQFVMDQYGGEFLINDAFNDQIIPGWGCLAVCLNQDPRKEKVKIAYRDWKDLWWDPFGSPWLEPTKTRYVFYQPWMDLATLQAIYSKKKKDIEAQYNELAGSLKHDMHWDFLDEATRVEEERRLLSSSHWVNVSRSRVRPVQMWYVHYEPCWFASFANGNVIEIVEDLSDREIFQIVSQAASLNSAVVPKIRFCNFFGDLELSHDYSPYPHDMYPYVPFVGYVDRFGFPFGVPRQIRGQNEEVNKRRSMALALLRKRRVIAERGVVPDGNQEALDDLYNEANKIDGFMVIEDNKSGAFQIVEGTDLMQSQLVLLQQSEREMREIAPGGTAEFQGYEAGGGGGAGKSGVAIERLQQQSSVMAAPLMQNVRRSTLILGAQTGANIQGYWTDQKVLRITDRLTGADRFVALNELVPRPDGGYEIRNNITQGKYDYVVTQVPATDTVREQYLGLLERTIQKSPPEVVPQLLALSFELMDLPNKEELLARIKPLLGVSPEDEGLSPEEVKQKALEQIKAQQEAAQKQTQIAEAMAQLEIAQKEADVKKTDAETGKIQDERKALFDRVKMERAKTVQSMRRKPEEKEEAA